ncbi:5'-3' exonuclease [Bacillus sp. FJAT-47783]|uniref:5'-3' exonuclease n=1 Tax=Bacillus sp. FJAT-47783 TaxID=2922712 RepID=UPI001FAC5EB0|nr:5'-3' exonuclease [Bacillus sp. FJAT-47783]
MKHKMLLIDGMALLFRSYFATAIHGRFMENRNGIPTNGVNGLVRHVLTVIDKFAPQHVICCWDMGAKTFRNEMYNAYKANRSEPPAELIPQFDLAKEVMNELNITNIGVENFEADDCIGTIAERYKHDYDMIVVTGDRDLLQLVDQNVHVAILQKGIGNYIVYTLEQFLKEYEITPKQLIDVKALMGDSSDNYPGVKGIGEKTAYKLIRQYQSIEQLLQNVDQLTPSQYKKMVESMDDLKISRKLAEIYKDVPLQITIEKTFKLTSEQLERTLQKFDVRKIATKNIQFLHEVS